MCHRAQQKHFPPPSNHSYNVTLPKDTSVPGARQVKNHQHRVRDNINTTSTTPEKLSPTSAFRPHSCSQPAKNPWHPSAVLPACHPARQAQALGVLSESGQNKSPLAVSKTLLTQSLGVPV